MNITYQKQSFIFSNSLFVFVLFLLGSFSFNVLGQDMIITPKEKLSPINEDNKIEIIKNEQDQPIKINFICNTSGDICKSIDIVEQCPFENLDFPKVPRSNFGRQKGIQYTRYDLSNVPYEKVIGTLLPHVSGAIERPCKPYATTTNSSAVNYGNYTIIRYSFTIEGEAGGSIAGNTYTQMYNKKGELVFALKNANTGARSIKITDDGRYLAYMYGGYGGPHGDCIVGGSSPYGVKVLDTHTGEVLVNEQPGKVYFDSVSMVKNNFFVVYQHENGVIEARFFVPQKNKIYHKKYALQEYSKLLEITSESMVFKAPNSSADKVIHFFEKDFTQKPIK